MKRLITLGLIILTFAIVLNAAITTATDLGNSIQTAAAAREVKMQSYVNGN